MFELPILVYLAAIILFAAMVFLSEVEAPGIAATLAAAPLAVAWYFYGFNPFLWIANNPWVIVKWGALYIVAGVLWSLFKFDRYARERAEDYAANKKAYPGNRLGPNDKDTGIPYVRMEDYIPTALGNKHKITDWIVLWWASLFWFLCSEFLTSLVNFIIRHCGRFYDALAHRHFPPGLVASGKDPDLPRDTSQDGA